MSKAEKLLERMRANPLGWRIEKPVYIVQFLALIDEIGARE